VVELEAMYTAWRAGAKADMNKDITANNIAYVTSDPVYAITRFFASNQVAARLASTGATTRTTQSTS
jgi:peptide/nickel transport system substrate-binding protein